MNAFKSLTRTLTTSLLLLMAADVVHAEVKKSIAVAPIGNRAGTVNWVSGEAIQAQLITELDKTGRYRVVERENIQGIKDEQDMGKDGRTRGGSGPATGDIEGAQLMIKCMITDAEEKSGKGGQVGGGIINVGGSKTKYKITMDVRVYDTQTTLILGTSSVSAEQEKKEKSGGIGIGGIGASGNKSGGDTTGEITRELIKQCIDAIDKHTQTVSWKSTIVNVKESDIIIRGGTRDGLENGMKLKVFKLGEAIKDEDTGEVLDAGKETEIGEVEITQVKDKVAYAKKLSGEDPQKGNVVSLVMAQKAEPPKPAEETKTEEPKNSEKKE